MGQMRKLISSTDTYFQSQLSENNFLSSSCSLPLWKLIWLNLKIFERWELQLKSITTSSRGGESVNELRIKLMNQTIQGMKKKLHESSPSPGALQQEARNMFISRMQQALQLAMSKHDQVVAVNATCLGRIKLPTCIACDRPMGTKVPTPSSRHFHT
jgi:hypothetical protein